MQCDDSDPIQTQCGGFDPWSRRIPHAVGQLSPLLWVLGQHSKLCCTTREIRALRNLCSATRVALRAATREWPPAATKTQHSRAWTNLKKKKSLHLCAPTCTSEFLIVFTILLSLLESVGLSLSKGISIWCFLPVTSSSVLLGPLHKL